MTPRLVVAGLGPGGPDLLTAGTRSAIARADTVVLRTSRHPAAAEFAEAITCDDLYESSSSTAEVYSGIVERLVELTASGRSVVYAVPGSPLVAERTVQLLLADDRIDVDVMAALSFLDLAWVRLGIDPMAAGVTIVDGHRFAVEAAGLSGPLLVCQCDTVEVLSDIKLAFEDWPEEPPVLVQRLGLDDESIAAVPWEDLDREIDPDHLTSLYVPKLADPVASELVRFDELVHTLRERCPWDRQQTNQTLTRYLIEESYEAVEAIDQFDADTGDGADEMCEELGDVLFQVFLHATIAAETGWFNLADVASGIHDKLRERHPHVFAGAEYGTPEQESVLWEHAKRAEKSRQSAFDGIPAALPALLSAAKTIKKARVHGLTVSGLSGSATGLVDEAAASGSTEAIEAIGDLLLSVAARCQELDVNPEDALRLAVMRFRQRVEPEPT